jgi:hypothetical protein
MNSLKKSIMIAVFLGLFAGSALARQELLYDGLKDYPKTAIAPEVEARLKAELLPRVKKYWQGKAFDFESSCAESFRILDGAQGSFTRSDKDQLAYLYNYCGGPAENSYQGVVVLENSRVVGNFAFSTILLQYRRLIAGEGYILLVGESLRDRSDRGVVSVVEIQRERIVDVIDLDYYVNSCASLERKRCFYTAYKIYCSIGDGYFFYQEPYQKRAGKWIKTRPRKWIPDDPSIEREIIEPSFIK